MMDIVLTEVEAAIRGEFLLQSVGLEPIDLVNLIKIKQMIMLDFEEL